MTPTEALQHIRTLVDASAELKDDKQRKVLLRGAAWSPRRASASRRMVWPNARLTF